MQGCNSSGSNKLSLFLWTRVIVEQDLRLLCGTGTLSSSHLNKIILEQFVSKAIFLATN